MSQKDPAECLLELQAFHAISNAALQRHHIDAKLGRHRQALKHAVDAGAVHHATALQYATEHGLLRNLLELLRDQPALLEEALKAYATVRTAPCAPCIKRACCSCWAMGLRGGSGQAEA